MSKRALLSVYDKTGIEELANGLRGLGFELVSSGGTAAHLKKAGVQVTDVATITGVPPILDHRVVTLHPVVHGGILAIPDKPEHKADMARHHIEPFDLVVVSVYPFADKPSVELIDIGGPTMIRAAAKNHASVGVVTDIADYDWVLQELRELNGELSSQTRARLAQKAFATIAEYDAQIASWMYGEEALPDSLHLTLHKTDLVLKYGENAWQAPAAMYSTGSSDPLSLDRFEVVEGTDPSFNNLCDLDRLLQTITHVAAGWSLNFGQVPLIAIAVKHGNACGAAVGNDPVDVITRMYQGDTRAIFGGMVMTNFPITGAVAEKLKALSARLDGIAAPDVEEKAIDVLGRKGGKCRFLSNPALQYLDKDSIDTAPRMRFGRGVYLRQPNYDYVLNLGKVVAVFGNLAGREAGLVLSWAIGSTSNSNTICLVKDGMLIGNGVGQQDRVGCCELALKRARDAGHDPDGATAYSDSFFPFEDGVDALLEAGVKNILTTNGSIKDQDVADAFLEIGLLFWQPDAGARGFFGH